MSDSVTSRSAKIHRQTGETDILISVDLDGLGESSIETGVPFFDHMLTLFSKHSLIDLEVAAKGDIEVDFHHTVEDTGIGMDEETRERIFEKFFTTKAEEGGTGLGLATVLEVTKWHGGTVDVESELGRGTRIRVCLPRKALVKQRPSTRSTGDFQDLGEKAGRSGLILLVDDDEMILTLVRRALARVGYQVLTASTSEEAIAIVGDPEHSIDATILDTSLSEIEFVTTLTGVIEALPRMRLILSGTRARNHQVLQFSHVAPDLFLEKPFGPEELIHIVQQVVKA